MKKMLSLLLTVLLLLGTVLSAVPALAAAPDARDYPTIIVPGYSSSDLFLNGEQIWGLDKKEILNTVLSKIAFFGRGLGELALKKPDYLTDLLGEEIQNYVGKLAMNPDGSSVEDIETYAQDAAHTQYAYLYEKEHGAHVHEPEIMKDIAKQYGADGTAHIFAYQQDFRCSAVDCAATLDRYIDDVLAFTGAEKVNIIALSHGGQTVSAYLSLYGLQKNVVNNLLLAFPAIGGVAAAYDLMSETAELDEETLVNYFENNELMEEDVNWLVRAHQFGVLDDVCNALMHKYVKDILGYWGSIWDFIPAEHYDELKQALLDPEASAALIAKSDRFHYDILPKIGETFAACEAAGMKIAIVAGAGMPVLTGTREQSDFVVTVGSSTGAKSAPFGSRFSDGYRQIHSVCTDEGHNHLSPDMCIDVSCGYLPESTWIVSGMYHGTTWKDPYCRALCKQLLFANEPVDVNSFAKFPQFQYSSCPAFSVSAALDRSPQGYWSGEDTALTVKNLSEKNQMRLLSVSVDGVDAAFELKSGLTLAPGEAVSLPLKKAIPEISLTTADITVNYYLENSKTPFGSRTLTFTLMNGDAPDYDAAAPYTDALQKTAFDQTVPERVKSKFERFGILDFLKMLFNTIAAFLRSAVGLKLV